MRPVVLTGLGTCGSFGAGVGAFLAALEAGGPAPTAIDDQDGFHRPEDPRSVHRCRAEELAPWLPGRSARRMSPASRFAVACARMALEDAGWEAEAFGGVRTGVSLGVGFGTSFAQRLFDAVLASGPEAAPPFQFIDSGANAPTGQIAVAFGARGPNQTVMQYQASGLLAVQGGAQLVATGRCDRVVTGFVNEIAPVLHAALARFGALADRGRPFAAERSGFVPAEGATVLVLEDEESARRRGARVYGRVAAGVRANDPSACPIGWGTGARALGASLERGLARHDVTPASIDRVVSTASGSVDGDALEAGVLRRFFGGAEVPELLCPKGPFGEFGGANLLTTVAALFPADLSRAGAGGEERAIDPALELAPRRSPEQPRRVLSTALAAGGAAAWLVLDRPQAGDGAVRTSLEDRS